MNAKEEFLEETKDYKVVCAKVNIDKNSYGNAKNWVYLKKGYSKKEFDSFLKKIDKEYDGGYGGQELFGLILCEDGIWFDRYEYDGSERWDKHKYPSEEELLTDK